MAAQGAMYGGLAALELAGGYFASQNIKETARLNQEIAEMNAKYAELDAYDAMLEGESQEVRYQSVIDETLSDQRAILAASNVDTNFGTASSIEAETKFIGQINLMEIEKRGQEQALGYTNQAANYRIGGVLQKAQADVQASSVMTQSLLGAGRTGITGYRKGL